MRRDGSGGGVAAGAAEGAAGGVAGAIGAAPGRVRRWGIRWGAAALALLLLAAGGCGGEAPRESADASGGAAPDRSVEIPSGSESLPASAGLAIPDTLEPVSTGPTAAPEAAEVPDADGARAVVRDYYAAIAAGNYERAYGMWGDGGKRSGQTFLEFAAGFAGTQRVRVEAGAPGRAEGAAGSVYVEVPVVVEATTRTGSRQRFEGSYTLRRAVVDGATEAQRTWSIYDAEMERVD